MINSIEEEDETTAKHMDSPRRSGFGAMVEHKLGTEMTQKMRNGEINMFPSI